MGVASDTAPFRGLKADGGCGGGARTRRPIPRRLLGARRRAVPRRGRAGTGGCRGSWGWVRQGPGASRDHRGLQGSWPALSFLPRARAPAPAPAFLRRSRLRRGGSAPALIPAPGTRSRRRTRAVGQRETESRLDGSRPLRKVPPPLRSGMHSLTGHALGSQPPPISAGIAPSPPPPPPLAPRDVPSWLPGASTSPGMTRTRSSRLPSHPSPLSPEPPVLPPLALQCQLTRLI